MKKVLFLISKHSGLSCLSSFVGLDVEGIEVEVITLNDKNDIRSCLSEIKKYCYSAAVKFTVADSNNEFIKLAVGSKIDAIFVCGWYWIIPENIISQVKGQIFGIHHSLLPKYRGFSPLVWSLINGDKIVGSSLFRITQEMDAGTVYHQWEVENNSRSIGDVLDEIEFKISKNFGHVFLDVLQSVNKGIEQNNKLASYCARRTVTSGHINWNCQASQVLDFINANSHPYPGAWFLLLENKHIIESAQLFEYPVLGTAGQVVMFFAEGVVIACGDNKGVLIKKIKGTDKVRMVIDSLDAVLK